MITRNVGAVLAAIGFSTLLSVDAVAQTFEFQPGPEVLQGEPVTTALTGLQPGQDDSGGTIVEGDGTDLVILGECCERRSRLER